MKNLLQNITQKTNVKKEANMKLLQLKRVYDQPEDSDGFRILIDRLWPRGLKKTDAHIDLWCKDIAPSPALRSWFHHEPERFDLFRAAYLSELDKNPVSVQFMSDCNLLLKSSNVTLLYAAKDTTQNNATVLLKWLVEKLEQP